MRTVADVMSTTLYTVTPDTSIASAARFAFTDQARHILVLDQGVLAGVVSHRDLTAAVGKKTVGEIMRTPVLCIDPTTTIEDAGAVMAEHDVCFLPIVDKDRVLGFVDEVIIAGRPRTTTKIGFASAVGPN